MKKYDLIKRMMDNGLSAKEIMAKSKLKPSVVYNYMSRIRKATPKKIVLNEAQAKLIHRLSQGRERLRMQTHDDAVKSAKKTLDDMGVTYTVSTSNKSMNDLVNHPEHYTFGGIETIDYMQAKSTKEEFTGHLRLTALKYLSRANHKGDTLRDLKKAQWYLNRLVTTLEK